MEPIKIILVDDEVLFRKGIFFLLQREPNFEIIFEASDGQELINYLKNTTIHPDIIMMDLKMPTLNGVEATKIIRKDFPKINIIALTSYNTDTFIKNMIEIGASSYLIKNATPIEMVETITKVASQGFYYSEAVYKILNSEIQIDALNLELKFLKCDLSSREREVLTLICKQYSATEIAEKLCISARTVDGHRNNLLLKTEAKNIAGLVVFAIQNKIVLLD
ncbi:MAG: response regulator transcription factor [Flavobacterium sp.]|jgi:DNA-binding NarL/FixJ family response regulator|uniref:response regulator transcription factor n=1 Tax=Flavobacterium sp. TaxID=239 RepID=UPI002FDA35AE|nr:response regulator transcription factor [Bacteroidota bacterium]